MAPTKATARASPAVVPSRPSSRLHPALRLPILLLLNLGLSSALWSFESNFFERELGSISYKTDGADVVTPATRLGYKVLVIWLGWRLDYDFIDISALTAVTNVPFAYLVQTYYNISLPTAVLIVANEVLAIGLPTYLLRPRSAVNNRDVPLRNRYLLDSFQVHVSNVILAIGVYVVVTFLSLKSTTLSAFLVTHFDLLTMETAYTETPFALVAKVLVAGAATKAFLLNPSLGAASASGQASPVEPFSPATATLPQTLKQNFWYFSRRTRTLIRQTVVLGVFVFANTVQRCWSLSNEDTHFSTRFVGAAGYSGPWVLSAVICAGWWVWIGDADA